MRHPERVVGGVTALLAALAFLILAAVLVPWEGAPSHGTAVPAPETLFAPAEVARAEAHSTWARTWSWSGLAVSLLAVTFFVTPKGRDLLARWVRGPWWVQVVLVVLLVSAAVRLATLPFSVLSQQHRRDAGLSVQTWGEWARDVAVGLGVNVVVSGLALVVLVALMRRWRHAWPAVAAGGVAVAVVLGSWVYPVVVEPLFTSFAPMEHGPMRDEVLATAEREGVHLDDVLVADASQRTTSLNAYVSGLGSTRRVVVYDTLLADLPPDQVLTVVAHEVAHAAHRDVLVGTVLGALGSAAAVGLLPWLLRRRDGAGPDVIRLVGAVLVLVAWGGVITAPVENGISRQIELRADRDALKATGDPVAFVEVQKRLALRSLADPTPPRVAHWWWGSHPTVLERVALARD